MSINLISTLHYWTKAIQPTSNPDNVWLVLEK